MADVFPRRNLPPQAEQWGREVERRVTASELDISTLQQGLAGQNRNTASSLSVIAQQLHDIQATQASIPITSSQSAFTADFALPSTDYATIVRVDIPNPGDRRRLSILCTGNVRIYETNTTPTQYSQSHIRIYNAGTDALITFGGSNPSVRDGRPSGTLHAGTPFQASTFTTPEEGIYVTLEILVTDTAAFPFDDRNLAELAVQTSFL